MLGSTSEAQDAVQEAWLRPNRYDTAAEANMGGRLTTVVGRVCLDMLRARQARREDYAGSWLPGPIVSIEQDGDPGPLVFTHTRATGPTRRSVTSSDSADQPNGGLARH